MQPNYFTASLEVSTRLEIPVLQRGIWEPQPEAYLIEAAFVLSDATDARQGISGGVVLCGHGVVGLAHFARGESATVSRQVYMVPLMAWAEDWPELRRLMTPLEASKRRGPGWLRRVAIVLSAFGGTLLGVGKLSVWGVPPIVLSVAFFLEYLYRSYATLSSSYLYRSLRFLWAAGTVVFLVFYALLYLPRFQDRRIEASWTPNPPLISMHRDKDTQLFSSADLPHTFDETPPTWIRWLPPGALFWESFLPSKVAMGLKVDNQEISVTDTDPVLFPPLSESREQINDFNMDLTFAFRTPQDVASWAIRTDETRTHYYLFALSRDESDPTKARIQAWNVSGKKRQSIDARSIGRQWIEFPAPTEDLQVRVHLDADKRCKFKYWFIFNHALLGGDTCWVYPEYVIPDDSCYLRGRPGLVRYGTPAAKISNAFIDEGNSDADTLQCGENPAAGKP
jgi:hypothetical protein